jgi:hypothetical protein
VTPLTDFIRLIRLQPMLGVPVLVREHGNGLRAQLVRGPERPDRDLTTVGHQHLREHL